MLMLFINNSWLSLLGKNFKNSKISMEHLSTNHNAESTNLTYFFGAQPRFRVQRKFLRKILTHEEIGQMRSGNMTWTSMH